MPTPPRRPKTAKEIVDESGFTPGTITGAEDFLQKSIQQAAQNLTAKGTSPQLEAVFDQFFQSIIKSLQSSAAKAQAQIQGTGRGGVKTGGGPTLPGGSDIYQQSLAAAGAKTIPFSGGPQAYGYISESVWSGMQVPKTRGGPTLPAGGIPAPPPPLGTSASYNPLQIAAPQVPGIARQTTLPSGQVIYAGGIGTTAAGPGTITTAALGRAAPNPAQIFGGNLGGGGAITPPPPQGTIFGQPPPPAPYGLPGTGLGNPLGNINWGSVGKGAFKFGIGAAEAGVGMYSAGVLANIGVMQQNRVQAGMLQAQIGSVQGSNAFWNTVNRGAANQVYGYTNQEILAAGQQALPFIQGSRRNQAQALNQFAAFGSTTGIGIQGAGQLFGTLGQQGYLGGPGGMNLPNVAAATAVTMGMGTPTGTGDWVQGLQDLARPQREMDVTATAKDYKSLAGYYGAFNATGIQGLAGTQGAQVMGQINQGIASGVNATGVIAAQSYQALGAALGEYINPSDSALALGR